jgi:hypothetical protein
LEEIGDIDKDLSRQGQPKHDSATFEDVAESSRQLVFAKPRTATSCNGTELWQHAGEHSVKAIADLIPKDLMDVDKSPSCRDQKVSLAALLASRFCSSGR